MLRLPARCILDTIHDGVVDHQIGMDEARSLHVFEQFDQRLPEAIDVGDQNRLAVTAELRPGQLLHQFLERADPSGQGDERIGALEHHALALVHVARDDDFLARR